jgi:hypothetical protein
MTKKNNVKLKRQSRTHLAQHKLKLEDFLLDGVNLRKAGALGTRGSAGVFVMIARLANRVAKR